MKQKIKIAAVRILIYACIYIMCSFLFVLLFHTGLFSGMKVLMYRGIFFLLLSGVIAAALMGAMAKRNQKLKLDGRDVLLMFCGFCCVNMVIFTLIPVTVERSVSVFMLSYMEESTQKAFTEEEIKDAFIGLYVEEFGAFQKRFEEQVVSGNMTYDDGEGGYVLTPVGKKIVWLFRVVADIFNVDRRLVYPISLEQ